LVPTNGKSHSSQFFPHGDKKIWNFMLLQKLQTFDKNAAKTSCITKILKQSGVFAIFKISLILLPF
jgi:hypothetical protein